MSTFVAYPDGWLQIGGTLEAGAALAREDGASVQTWRETDIAGKFIATEVLESIRKADCFAADISYLNFNVTYEIGYAIGAGKPVILLRHAAVDISTADIAEVGIFDTIGYEKYTNKEDVAAILRRQNTGKTLLNGIPALNHRAPVYLLDAKFKTDVATRIISRVKKARLFFRSFDPNEQARLGAPEAIRQVGQSYGVLVHLLARDISDSTVHNLRAAFIAGLALGLGKANLILQHGNDPVPLDYRDAVWTFKFPDQINDAVGDFATKVTEALQTASEPPVEEPRTFLERLNLGASAAENELRDLGQYYLETDSFQKAQRGEVRLVVGRKGSGKTAIFARVRDKVRRNKANLVLDLRPEGYRLLKFKEDVLRSLQEGTYEHAVTAFWEYVLLLEVCHKILEKDKKTHQHRGSHEAYYKLSELYRVTDYASDGDFSERMAGLLEAITGKYNALSMAIDGRLSDSEITNLIYLHNVPMLRAELDSYLRNTAAVLILFDNIDSGWPTRGLEREDLVIVRALIEALRKIERHLNREAIECHTLVFLRNDVYELLVEETPDRGKESKVLLDWTDPDLLRELLRRRFVFNGAAESASFEEVWRAMCVSHVGGEESSQYLIDRCLMRPRSLIDIVNHCRSVAVNLRHVKVEPEDIHKGLKAYSTDLLTDIGFEIRDINPDGEGVLYGLVGEKQLLEEAYLISLLQKSGLSDQLVGAVIELMLWYGVLGVEFGRSEIAYIYSVNYDMNLLRGIIRKRGSDGVVFHVNPAFWPALGIEN